MGKGCTPNFSSCVALHWCYIILYIMKAYHGMIPLTCCSPYCMNLICHPPTHCYLYPLICLAWVNIPWRVHPSQTCRFTQIHLNRFPADSPIFWQVHPSQTDHRVDHPYAFLSIIPMISLHPQKWLHDRQVQVKLNVSCRKLMLNRCKVGFVDGK